MKKLKVVVIGGGTGTYSTLLALKTLPVQITAIVSMADSGGSNRVIRDEFGLLPTSDIRQALVALSSPKANQLIRDLFTYRYNQGIGITGMTFGNLFMAAVTDIFGSQQRAIEATCKLLKVKGQILPVTYDDAHLLAKYSNGKQRLGEHQIDDPGTQGKFKIINLEMVPQASANPKAITAIQTADFIIFSPGDLYTSIICNLLVDGLAQIISSAKAKKIFFVNLMTRFGQTNGFKVSQHISQINHYLTKDAVDYALINNNQDFPPELIKKYRDEEKANPVKDDLKGKKTFRNCKLIRADLLSNLIYQKPASDKLVRSLIRHDPVKMAAALGSIMIK